MKGRLLRAGAALCIALIVAAPAAADATRRSREGTATEVWGDLVIPGGAKALLRAAEVKGFAEEWRAVPLLIELSFTGPQGARLSRKLQEYAEALDRLRKHAAAVAPDGVLRLAMAAGERQRRDFENLLETLGLAFERRRTTVRWRTGRDDQSRIAALAAAGLPMDDLVERLNAGESVSLVTKDSIAPLPLGQAFWAQRLDPARAVVWAILESREMASLYYALMSMDEATLAAVQADAKLASTLIRRAAVLPLSARALRVREGRVIPAGGDTIVPLWEDLVGAALDRPSVFFDQLLRLDGGRLAYFFATVAALPRGTAMFVAGDPSADIRTRRDRFRRLYSVFRESLTGWTDEAPGILAPVGGPVPVLFSIHASERGTLAGPPWRDFWRRAFESDDWPADPARSMARLDADPIDAAGLLDMLCSDYACNLRRTGIFTFLQREFAEVRPDAAPLLLGIVRTRSRYPALALEIQRMHLGDPDAYLRLGGMAFKLEQLGQPQQAIATIQFQAAVALLGRLRAVGVPAAAVREHLSALASIPVGDDGFGGGLIRWLSERVFVAEEGEDIDDAALRMLSGAGRTPPGPVVEWEGLRYRLDLASTERDRIGVARAKFSANTLATSVALLRAAGDVTKAAGDAAAVQAFVAALEEVVNGSRDVDQVWWPGKPASFDSFRKLTSETAETLRKAGPGDRKRIDRAIQPLLRAADLAAADALAALVYAVALQDPENPLDLSRELPRRHHLESIAIGRQPVSAWTVPQELIPSGTPRHVGGSLLALDAGIVRLSRRRLTSARPELEPNISERVAEGLFRTAALTTVWRATEADRAAIDAVRQQGETVVAGWRKAGRVDRPLADAGIAGPRAGWITWSLTRGDLDPALFLRREDMVRLAGQASVGASWGVAAAPLSCLCVGFPPLSWEISGQPLDHERASGAIVEPALRVAEELGTRKLPVALASGVLALLMTDLADNGLLPHALDVHAISMQAARIPAQRFDDYIAAVAARGPMVRVDESGAGDK